MEQLMHNELWFKCLGKEDPGNFCCNLRCGFDGSIFPLHVQWFQPAFFSEFGGGRATKSLGFSGRNWAAWSPVTFLCAASGNMVTVLKFIISETHLNIWIPERMMTCGWTICYKAKVNFYIAGTCVCSLILLDLHLHTILPDSLGWNPYLADTWTWSCWHQKTVVFSLVHICVHQQAGLQEAGNVVLCKTVSRIH